MRGTLPIVSTLVILAGSAAAAADMAPGDYKAARARIAADYQADRQKCGARHGNAADLCIARAHGAQAVAKAELEALHEPSPRANYKAALARAKAAYANAREECDDRDGAARKTCVRAAAAKRDHARAEAKLR